MVVVVRRNWLTQAPKLNRLKELRERFHLSQIELGKVLSVAHNTIFYWEHGQVDIKKEYLIKLSGLFKVSIDYILGVTEEDGYDEETICAVECNLKNTLLEAAAEGCNASRSKGAAKRKNSDKQPEHAQTKVHQHNALKALRKQKKVSQSTLARELNIDIYYISYWEHGLYDIDDDSLHKLAEYFGVSPQAILNEAQVAERTEA